MTVYDFDEQRKLGEQGEQVIDRTIATLWPAPLVKASMKEQAKGIDRFLVLKNGRSLTLEYKTDYAAQKTGRIFLETVKNVALDRPGWALTTTADRLVWYLPGLGTEPGTGIIIIVPVYRLYDKVLEWMNTHKTLTVDNKTYQAQGVAPVVAIVQKLASKVFDNVAPWKKSRWEPAGPDIGDGDNFP